MYIDCCGIAAVDNYTHLEPGFSNEILLVILSVCGVVAHITKDTDRAYCCE